LLALNVRSTVLIKLNRKEESFATIEGALRNDPNNAYTHANYGWGLLEKGDHKKALKHFKEALKNNPNFDYAQKGMIEALKASNPVYRLFLKYAFWIGNMGAKYQWIFLLGFWFGNQALNKLAEDNASLRPILVPVIILLAIFAFSTWVIKPISNLFLRFNAYGKFLLNKQEKMSANFVAVALVVLLTGVCMYLYAPLDKYIVLGGFGFAMMVLCGMMFLPSKYNSIMLYTITMAILGLVAIWLAFTNNAATSTVFYAFIIGLVAFQVLVNFLVIRRSNR